jgi:hypothetical protein
MPPHLKAQIARELDRLELLLGQIEAVEIERDALLSAMKPVSFPLGGVDREKAIFGGRGGRWPTYVRVCGARRIRAREQHARRIGGGGSTGVSW